MKAFALFALAALPMLASAQSGELDSLQDVGTLFISLINNLFVPIVFALSFLVFIWGVFNYFIRGAANGEAKEQGGQLILYSILGFFIMISVWGLVRILTGTFRTDSDTTIRQNELPDAPGIIR